MLRRSIVECCGADHHNDRDLLGPWLANKTIDNVRKWIDDDGTVAIVAETDGSIVGVAMMIKSGEVTLLYVVPEVLFCGVGKALLAELEAGSRRLGLPALTLRSTKTAHEFYRRNGFRAAGDADSWHGIVSFPMVKELEAGFE